MADQAEGPWFSDDTYDKQGQYILERLRHDYFISCWTQAESESLSWWGTKDSTSRAVVVQSSITQAQQSLCENDDTQVSLVKMEYHDIPPELSYDVPDASAFSDAFCYKSKIFEDENEVRFIAGELGNVPTVENLNLPMKQLDGIQIDASTLISEIRVSPYSAQWLIEMIRNLVSRLNVETTVKTSDFYDTFHIPKMYSIPEFAYGWHDKVKPKGLWRLIPLAQGGHEYARIQKIGDKVGTE